MIYGDYVPNTSTQMEHIMCDYVTIVRHKHCYLEQAHLAYFTTIAPKRSQTSSGDWKSIGSKLRVLTIDLFGRSEERQPNAN